MATRMSEKLKEYRNREKTYRYRDSVSKRHGDAGESVIEAGA